MEARHCHICNVDFEEHQFDHNGTSKHRFNFLLYEWNKYRKALAKNRHGVEIEVQPKRINGFLCNYSLNPKKGKHIIKITSSDLLQRNNILEFQCTVLNNRKKTNVLLMSAVLLHPYELWLLIDPHNNVGERCIELQPGASYQVTVKFNIKTPVIGSYKIPISFNFQTVEEKPIPFTIARSLVVSIEDILPQEEAATGKSPFTNNEWPDNIEVFPPTQQQRYIDAHPIPLDMFPYLRIGLEEFQGMSVEMMNELRMIRAYLDPGHVTSANYRMFWHIMVWLEEVAQMLMLKRYNMENVLMTLNADQLELEVPGLAEKRPSVVVGDMIDVRVHDDHKAYRGVIRKVNDKTVEISYVDAELLEYIKNNPGIELDVRFVLSRLPLERMHQAVDQVMINGIVPALFPPPSLAQRAQQKFITIHDTEFFNELIVRNQEQKTAVVNILNNTSMQAPYIVFGPPGTGKTVTIVEAILQIKKQTKKNVLVCAPANAACDMLTEKLMAHCTRRELIRIISENVDKQSLNPLVVEYSNFQDGQFLRTTAEDLSEYRIVVTTLILIGRYCRRYHPDVVFIDEAAQPSEPEACCALAMIEKGKQIIVAGDPKQLGPSISSKTANQFGLGISLLERLMNLDLYTSLHPNFITMLKQNFRSHDTILRIPNELFYNNQLRAVSVKAQNDPLARVFVFERIQGFHRKQRKIVPPPGQAIEYCSIISQENRQGRSPSYYNYKEMQMVLKYVEALTELQFSDEADKVLPEQIGVVTPYVRQVYKIRETLRSNNFEGVEVGTTETFQGREKRVIIISTVRAKHDLLAYDKMYNLGFVKNEKRFNVAMTRAMSKLIVIGCAHVLGTDDKWDKYICLCENLSGFCGAPYARRTEDIQDNIVKRMKNVHLIDGQHRH